MKENRKLVTLAIIGFIVLVVSLGFYLYLTKEDKTTTLTILEKQWIATNKNKLVDFGIVSNIPVFDADGEGVFFDFLNAFTSATKLEFNKVSYNNSSAVKTVYAFKIVDKVAAKDIFIYRDNYALLTKEAVKYHSINDIKDLTIGVLKSDLSKVSKYLSGAVNITYKPYETVEALLSANLDPLVGAIVLPKTTYLKEIISVKTLNIAYNITELTQDYVITLGDNANLNTIIKKYYKKWAKSNYQTSYTTSFTNSYFHYSVIDEKEKVKFRSKRYAYGFTPNLPYDTITDDRLTGINNSLLKSFSKLANIEISYKQYSSMNALLTDFNSNNIDFFYGNNSTTKYKMDVFKTVSILDSEAMIVSPFKVNLLVNSLASLTEQEVSVVKDTKIAEILTANKIKVKSFDNIKDLLDNKKNTDILAIDSNAYNYYSRKELANYNVDYQFSIPNSSSFIARDIQSNVVFNDFFNFYLLFTEERTIIDKSYDELASINKNSAFIQNVITYGSYIALLTVIGLEIRKYIVRFERRKIPVISKSNKLKYVDMLTSLKNRTFLNDNIEIWDNRDVYPQTIIILDLNNVAYINDNYGHEEGDNVIKEAANILITNQIENSEIIRTNGNEFLVYLVGYDEKAVVAYMRKLNKEFKELAHGFGTAMGYSIINDAIKTIDDAVNEATLDMRNNKEELNN